MPSHEASAELARSIAEVATGAGTPTTALLTDMNQCLASNAGNALEVREAVEFLKNPASANPRLAEVTIALCAEVLQTSGLAQNAEAARENLQDALTSGRALERFARMVTALGGPSDFVENPETYLQPAPVQLAVHPDTPGVVTEVADPANER